MCNRQSLISKCEIQEASVLKRQVEQLCLMRSNNKLTPQQWARRLDQVIVDFLKLPTRDDEEEEKAFK
jgi:hypothetical protein